MLLGHHKNLTHDTFTIERVLLWHLLLEKYGPIIKYIKYPNNDTEFDLRRLQFINYDVTKSEITRDCLADRYCVNKLDNVTLPQI